MAFAAKNIDSELRHQQTADKVRQHQSRVRLVEYQVVGDDVVITSGPYTGQSAREVFSRGPNERDYIVKNLCMRNDPQVLQIIRSLCGQ